MRRAIVYAGFALASGAANPATQELVIGAWRGPRPRAAALACGTAVGLALKYVLDARCVFHARLVGVRVEIGRVVRYVVTSVVTTALFWSVELACTRLWRSAAAPVVGGALGLAAGYSLKYLLDLKLVFAPESCRRDVRRCRPVPGGGSP